MRSTRPPFLALLLAIGLAACGEAVTNPSLEGFPSDPRVVEGDWVTVHTETGGTVRQLPGEVVPAGGRILGSFQFARFGEFWGFQFTDGSWDGTRIRFSANMTINGVARQVDWTATFFPASGGDPPMLLLASDAFGGPSSPIVYLRPRDVE